MHEGTDFVQLLLLAELLKLCLVLLDTHIFLQLVDHVPIVAGDESLGKDFCAQDCDRNHHHHSSHTTESLENVLC